MKSHMIFGFRPEFTVLAEHHMMLYKVLTFTDTASQGTALIKKLRKYSEFETIVNIYI